MNICTVRIAPLALALGLISGAAQAALQGRDLNGSGDSYEAYYDTDLNITWLRDANYAQTSGYSSDGQMDWLSAATWVSDLSIVDAVNNIIYDNWRLPTVTDTGAKGCNFAYAGTDCGYNVDTATGEMAHLYYDELGNAAYYNTAGVAKPGQPYLSNPGPFINLREFEYWSTEYAPSPDNAWVFSFYYGYQGTHGKSQGNGLYALAVSPGDVGAVPEPETWAMLLAGLGMVGAAVRRRR